MTRRPCWVEISTGAFRHNFGLLAGATGGDGRAAVELLAIVKADAYGHGLAICASAAVEAGAHWLGVTSVEEGVAARAVCRETAVHSTVEPGSESPDLGHPDRLADCGPDAVETEILVISGPFAGQGAAAIASRLTLVVWEHWQLDELESAPAVSGSGSDVLRVHLELNTGMNRQGVSASELDAILDRFASGPEELLRLDGLMTHLYAADETDGAVTREQLAELERMVERVHRRGLKPTWLHVGNSAAVLAGKALDGLRAICERWGMRAMSRPGLALYGIAPAFEPDEPLAVKALRGKLRRVLAWKTQVVSVHSVEAGQVVGYNGTFVATEPMRVALLAVGYADGLRRELSNRGEVLVRGCRAPIVGRISMDQTVVDVTDVAGVLAGDEVVQLGRQGEEEIRAEDHAGWAGTIPWEIFTSITARVERRAV